MSLIQPQKKKKINRCLFSDPAGSGELVPPRLFSLRGVFQGTRRGPFHCGPSQQHLLCGRLQQVRPVVDLNIAVLRFDRHGLDVNEV